MEESMIPPEPLDSPSDSPVTPDNMPPSRDSVDYRRLGRIWQYGLESQTDPDALTAGLSGVNADLLELAMYIAQPLLAALHAGPRTIENVAEKTIAINQLVRVDKQAWQSRKFYGSTGNRRPMNMRPTGTVQSEEIAICSPTPTRRHPRHRRNDRRGAVSRARRAAVRQQQHRQRYSF